MDTGCFWRNKRKQGMNEKNWSVRKSESKEKGKRKKKSESGGWNQKKKKGYKEVKRGKEKVHLQSCGKLKAVKFIQFWELETESHDTWKCITAATSDIIRGHMLQWGRGGRMARQLAGFSKDNSRHLKKIIVLKIKQSMCVCCVLQLHTCQRGGGESSLG